MRSKRFVINAYVFLYSEIRLAFYLNKSEYLVLHFDILSLYELINALGIE